MAVRPRGRGLGGVLDCTAQVQETHVSELLNQLRPLGLVPHSFTDTTRLYVLTCLEIGHSRMTLGHLMSSPSGHAPICQSCIIVVTVQCIIVF